MRAAINGGKGSVVLFDKILSFLSFSDKEQV